ncbi:MULTISPECIES: type II secretion system minor pseudopilin GspJ [unclassified Psychrobacter]|uniref:type II secretion system minor pseudopilin GspJ n=1 Tax=unclassified Psychrobacter TaxID=196806 RepID=UPI003F47CF03
MRQQHGFTLLELMVAMAIFAMLAVAGWQVFDGVNRARERAQFHADQLAVLQYAYLQLQQDMGQIIAYQEPSTQNSSANGSSLNDSANDTNSEHDSIAAKPFMNLEGEQLSFVRYADPDPRYQTSPSLQRVEYVFTNERLIRRQYNSIQGGTDSVSLDTVLLNGITAGRWQAHLPEVSNDFPSASKQQINNNNSDNPNNDEAETVLLPKGIGMSFTYQDMPITWQWALAPQPLPNNSSGLNTNIGGNSDNENDLDNTTNGQ